MPEPKSSQAYIFRSCLPELRTCYMKYVSEDNENCLVDVDVFENFSHCQSESRHFNSNMC